jgi:D-sedoheptulose 7-phosphate isomerase
VTVTAADAVAAIGRRQVPAAALTAQARGVAELCWAMARRFHAGGKLLVFGNGGSATDAAHIAVEFVHPVIVGKRALPAMSLVNDSPAITGIAGKAGFDEIFLAQLRLRGRPADIALGLSADGRCRNVMRALEYGHDLGLLTAALVGGDGGELAGSPAVDHVVHVPAEDPLVAKEVQVTTYHILWELVHVFLEQPGLFGPEVIA